MKEITIVCRSSDEYAMMLYFIVCIESARNRLKRESLTVTPYTVFCRFEKIFKAESVYYHLHSQPLIYEKK